MYQVICVGAGPSGSLSAYLLAKAGMNVALIEKRAPPGTKLCGGGLSSKAFRLIQGVIGPKKLSGCSISGSYLCYKNEHLCYVSQDIENYSILRKDLDNALLNAAKDQGCDIYMPAEVMEVKERPSKVTVRLMDNTEIESDFLILAEGIRGRLYRQIGYSGNREWTMSLLVDVFPDNFPMMLKNSTLFDFGFFEKGYGWIFPKNDHIKIGVYYYCSPRVERTQIEAFKSFANGFKWANAGKIGKIKACPLPYKVDYPRFNTARTILVGDAAGAVENFFGEGLYYGFLTSKVASEVLIGCFNNGLIDFYTKELKRKVLSQINFSRLNARFFYSHQRFGYYHLARNRLMNKYYSKLIHGEATPKKIFYYNLAALPFTFLYPNLDDRDFSEINRIIF